MIEKWIIDRVLSVARIVDVVGDFCNLRKTGIEYTCACPLHAGKHLNHFKVSPKKNMFYCFVCGKGGGPVDFLMLYNKMSFPDAIRWLGRKYGIEVDEEQKDKRFAYVKPSKPKPIEYTEETLPTLSLPLKYVEHYRSTDNNLCRWMESLPWSDEQRARLPKVLKSYGIGTSRSGHTIFWQIDEKAIVRTGKMMAYRTDGHRDREARHSFDWIHSVLYRAQRVDIYDATKTKMRVCLFGLHLLNANMNTNTVNIVESEKTALLMATAMGSKNGLWMATGGLQFLKQETLQPLINRGMKIVLYPDHDGEEAWKEKMAKVRYNHIMYNDQWTRIYWKEEDGEKADCADVVVRMMTEMKDADWKNMLMEKLRERAPQFIEKFNLEIV